MQIARNHEQKFSDFLLIFIFLLTEDSPINTSSLDVTYDLKCQSDALRITKYNKLYGVVVCPVSDLQVALVMSDSRVLIWQLKSIDKQVDGEDIDFIIFRVGTGT